MINIGCTQVDYVLRGHLLNSNKDLMNHGPKFPEIYLTLIRLWRLNVGHKYSITVWVNVLSDLAYVADGTEWSSCTSPAYCDNNNTDNSKTYGRLFG